MKEDRDEFKAPKAIKTGRKERFPTAEGQCECCKKSGEVFITEDGDFCEACSAKMPWLK